MYEKIGPIVFPPPIGIVVNMMPISRERFPSELAAYRPLVDDCGFDGVQYLTVHESVVRQGDTQRRPGIHTDGTKILCWGGGGWGGGSPSPAPAPKPAPKPKRTAGIYMASTDGRCNVWGSMVYDVDTHGKVLCDLGAPDQRLPGTLYWMTDRTPHESLPSERTGWRQFFRLVSGEVSTWYSRHSTPNPLGLLPTCRIDDSDKFAK